MFDGKTEIYSEAITAEQIQVARPPAGPVFAAGTAESAAAVSTVLIGFSTDPVARWMYPGTATYLTWFPAFIRSFAGKAFENGTAWCTSDLSGAALWLPPEVDPDEDALVELFWNSTTEDVQSDLFPIFEAMGSYHPKTPHWYLPMIAVDTAAQGRGIGSALMRFALDRIDADALPAYLESSNPRNISLYQRFGFEVIGEIKIGNAPPLYPMLRNAV